MSKISFFDCELPSEAQKCLDENKIVRHFARGEVVYRVGDAPTGLHFIQKGLIGLVASGAHGNEYLIRLSKAEQYIGHPSLFGREPHHATAMALQDSEVVSVPKVVVLQVLEKHPSVMLHILESLSKNFKLAEMAKVSFADKGVVSRVAETVLYLRERFPEHTWTRKEIADYCGSTTATVIRTLARFDAEGIIHQRGRVIEITDRARLLTLATAE